MATFNESILTSSNLPSIFELLAQDGMSQALRPAIQYITKIIMSTINLNYNNYMQEIWAAIEGTLQGLFLWKYNASISENFYDLIRTNRRSSKWKSLIVMILVPYLHMKLEQLYDKLCEENELNSLSRLKCFLLLCIPYTLAVWKGIKFIFQLMYLCQKSVYYSPELWLSGVQLIRKTGNNTTPISTSSVLAVVIQYIGPVCLFALKFIEWWYSNEREETVKKISSLPVPPPPSPLSENDANSSVCPLCYKTRRNPTALSCSGFVFCYVCIFNYVRRYGVCPVTSIPTNENKLIRIFITNL